MNPNSNYLSRVLVLEPAKLADTAALRYLWNGMQDNNLSDLIYSIKEYVDIAIIDADGDLELIQALENIEQMAEDLDVIEKRMRPSMEIVGDRIEAIENNF